MQYPVAPIASLIRTPPEAGTWNAVLEDDDATAIDSRWGEERITLPDGRSALAVDELRRRLAAWRDEPDACLEVGLAPRSESNLVAGYDGRVNGVFVATYRALPIGARVDLTLCLPGGAEVDCHARVEWTREAGCRDGLPGIGLRFASIDPEDDDLLQTFAAYREPLFF